MKNKGKISDDEFESEDDFVKFQKKRDWDEWKDGEFVDYLVS